MFSGSAGSQKPEATAKSKNRGEDIATYALTAILEFS